MYTYIRINQLWNYHQPCHATDSITLALASLVDATQIPRILSMSPHPKVAQASTGSALSHAAVGGSFAKTFSM
jgi:hypothetical protein